MEEKKDATVDFYQNMLNVAEKTDNGYKVDVQKMFDGLRASGKHVTQIGAGYIISDKELTTEETAKYQKEADERAAVGAKEIGDAIDREILKTMDKKGLLNQYRYGKRK